MALLNKNNRNRQARKFAMESLDKRELFAADLMGAAELAVQSETVQTASSAEELETCDADGDQSYGRERVEQVGRLACKLLRLGRTAGVVETLDGYDGDRRGEKSVANGSDVNGSDEAEDTQRGSALRRAQLRKGRVDKATPLLFQGRARDLDNASAMMSHDRHVLGGGMTSIDADNDLACFMPVFGQPAGTAMLDGGVLTVVGTAGSDNISVMRDNLQVEVDINGNTFFFIYSDVEEIKIYGLCDDDVIVVGEEPGSPGIDESATVMIDAGQGNDEVHGSNGDDVIIGGQGNDVIFGNGGNDDIFGGDGDDEIHGGAGHDVIFGDAGNDWISGGDGNDYLNGGDGNDELYGDAGWDSLYGGAGDDGMFGGSGWDFIDSGTDSGNPAQGDYGDADTVILTGVAELKK